MPSLKVLESIIRVWTVISFPTGNCFAIMVFDNKELILFHPYYISKLNSNVPVTLCPPVVAGVYIIQFETFYSESQCPVSLRLAQPSQTHKVEH